MILAWVLTASAGFVDVMPARGGAPVSVTAPRQPLVVVWDGGPANVELRVGARWKQLARDVSSPWTSSPLPLASAIRVVGPMGPIGIDGPDGVWTPDDLAAWSGAGLHGAVVSGLASTGDAVWAATLGGGLALWDGARFREIDRRDGLPSSLVYSVALDGAIRWVGHDLGVTRIDADGGLKHWWVDGGAWDVMAGDRAGAWGVTPQGIVRFDDRGITSLIADPSCQNLIPHPDLRAVAACGEAARKVSDGEELPELRHPAALIGFVPRADGSWVGHNDSLAIVVAEERTPWWQPPVGVEITSLIQVGTSLMLSARGAPGSPGWRVTEAGAAPLQPFDGLPWAEGFASAPGPRADRAWIGTSRGLALVTEQGTATPLPLAPLPAGLAVHGVYLRPDEPEAGVAVAGEAGLVWLGESPPAGFSDLAAAVGSPAIAIVRDQAGGLFALNQRAAFRLAEGQLSRFELHADARGATAAGSGVAIATEGGVRWWLPGATMLSPGYHLAFDPEDIVSTDDGTVWVAGRDRVVALASGTTKTWDHLPSVYDLSPNHGGVWIATAEGAMRILSLRDEPQRTELRQDRLTGIAMAAGRLHVLDADGWLHRADPGGVTSFDLGIHAHINGSAQIYGDEAGAWVATSGGLFRILPIEGRPNLDGG